MQRPRLLLLTTAHSYRNEAFRAAAARAEVDVVIGYDMPPGTAPHLARADALPLDLDDPPAAAAAAAAFALQQPLAAVLPVDDSGVLAAAAVAAELGLASNAPAAAEAARDKYIMRTRMAAAGVPCPWFRRYMLDTDAHQADGTLQETLEAIAREVPYPCVLKPTTLNGSRGVMRADDPREFAARGLRLARLLARQFGGGVHPFLVESFIPGVEVALEGMLDPAGKAGQALTVLALFDKPDPLDGPFFEETIYVTPSRLPPAVQTAIAGAAAQAAAAIGLQTGPVHAELRVNEQGPWLLEIAGRSIGGLCGQILRFGFEQGDMSLEELIVRQACGLPWKSEPAAAAAGAAAAGAAAAGAGVMMIPIPEAGQLRGIDGVAAAEAVPGIEGVEISVPLHHTVTPLPEGDSYLGFIFARGETPGAVEEALRAAHAHLRFTIVPEISLDLG
jgi:biotin carboxylase